MAGLTLIGYRGCGKTTVAALLAPRLGLPWIDADDVVEQRAGRSIATLIGARGEPAFRDLESEVLAGILAGPPALLATGGGVVLRDANRDLVRRSGWPVVWLRADADTIRRRLAADPTTAERRPGLSGTDPLAEVAATIVAREPLYRMTADAEFDTAALPPERIVDDIVAWLGRRGWSATAPRGAEA